MRLDIRNMDRKYCAQFDVTLNGVKQTQCIVADSDKGYVIRYKTSKFGLHEMKNGKTVHERVEGLVSITNRSNPQLKPQMSEDKLLPHQKEIVARIESRQNQHRDELAKRKPEPAAETVGGLAKAVKAARGGDAPPAPMRGFA